MEPTMWCHMSNCLYFQPNQCYSLSSLASSVSTLGPHSGRFRTEVSEECTSGWVWPDRVSMCSRVSVVGVAATGGPRRWLQICITDPLHK